ncbi:TPA: hypothetical protein JFW75_003413 [Salmonella enterica]|nr:hypothetical protein [Salmonella enterica]
MARRGDIKSAFRAAIQISPEGYKFLYTRDFTRELRLVGWYFSEREANNWIERYQNDFQDRTLQHTENRFWMLRNMGIVR